MDFTDPFERFREIFARAEAEVGKLPNAMTVSTVAPDGQPTTRYVLLKDFDERGFVF